MTKILIDEIMIIGNGMPNSGNGMPNSKAANNSLAGEVIL